MKTCAVPTCEALVDDSPALCWTHQERQRKAAASERIAYQRQHAPAIVVGLLTNLRATDDQLVPVAARIAGECYDATAARLDVEALVRAELEADHQALKSELRTTAPRGATWDELVERKPPATAPELADQRAAPPCGYLRGVALEARVRELEAERDEERAVADRLAERAASAEQALRSLLLAVGQTDSFRHASESSTLRMICADAVRVLKGANVANVAATPRASS